MPRLQEILNQSAEKGLSLQKDSGEMPRGSNGPWNDQETPVRNTAHWTITFLETYRSTGDERFLEAGRKSAAYLLREELRPEGETFKCRTNPEKDRCNGLIGQAWIIEALSKAHEVLEEENYHETAVELFLKHPFDPLTGLWKTVEINGEVLGFDTTFNHQLWFAAAGSLLEDEEVNRQVDRFMERLDANLSLHSNGLVRHKLSADMKPGEVLEALKGKRFDVAELKFKELYRIWDRGDEKKAELTERAVGYHSFNMYGFALLYQAYPENRFWETDKFRETVEAIDSEEYRAEVEENMYSYPYNPPGIENAFALQKFGKSGEKLREWLEKQFNKTFDFETCLMERRASDRETCSARIYEATRLKDMELELNDHE